MSNGFVSIQLVNTLANTVKDTAHMRVNKVNRYDERFEEDMVEGTG